MQDDYTPRGPQGDYGRPDYSPPAYARYAHGTPQPVEAANSPSRLGWMLALLGFMLLMMLGPMIIQRFQYANTYGKERAKVDVAMAGLAELDRLNLEGLAEASRLVAQKVGPSVVHIRTVRVGDERVGDETSHLFGFPRNQQQSLGEGSGVIVDDQGYIVTNQHVIAGAVDIDVQLSDGRRVAAEIVGVDKPTDIAVLKVNADHLIANPWGNSDALEVGDLIWAVGSPFGLDRSVTFGIVSAKGRRGVTNSRYQEFLQTDAAVNPGNSGGPLVNIRGEIVGINTAIVGPSYQGISFAIPSAIAKDIFEKIQSGGRVARGWLGVALRPLTAEQVKELGLPAKQGVVVEQVVEGSPAQKSGIQPGDIILEWNGKAVEDATSLSWMVANTKVAAEATVRLRRGDRDLALKVTVDELPGKLQQ